MSSYMDFIKEQLYTLTSIPSPSGFTRKATDYLLSELSSLGYSPERSNKGNSSHNPRRTSMVYCRR